METVNNIAAAATKAIWGESESPETTEAKNNAVVPETKKEPLSGVLGDTKKGEPYDLGNAGRCFFVSFSLRGEGENERWRSEDDE